MVYVSLASLVAQRIKRLPAMQETQVQSLGWEDPLEKEMATHSSTLAWRIPWTEEPGRLQSTGSQRVGHDWATSLQWLYNIQLKTSRGVLFLPPSDAYIRSFLYLLYTLIKLYYTKALSDQTSSLAPDWILLLQRPRTLASFCSATTFQSVHFFVQFGSISYWFVLFWQENFALTFFFLQDFLINASVFILPHEFQNHHLKLKKKILSI